MKLGLLDLEQRENTQHRHYTGIARQSAATKPELGECSGEARSATTESALEESPGEAGSSGSRAGGANSAATGAVARSDDEARHPEFATVPRQPFQWLSQQSRSLLVTMKNNCIKDVLDWYRQEDVGDLRGDALNELVENMTALNAREGKIWKLAKSTKHEKMNQNMQMDATFVQNSIL